MHREPLSPFDRVLADTGLAGESAYSVEQFLELPLYHRVQLVLAGRLRFYLGETEVPTSIALRWLRERAASAP